MKRSALLLATFAFWLQGQGLARANGRAPASVRVMYQPGETDRVYLHNTFGLLVFGNDFQDARWICENTIGYGGTYDPDYAINDNGDIYATTFDGLKVSRDGGQTFEATSIWPRKLQRAPLPFDLPLTNAWVGEVEIASDGRIWATTSTGGQPNDVYVSSDGTNFYSVAEDVGNPGLWHPSTWWRSVKIAPSDTTRVYVTGFDPGPPPVARLFRSDDGGETWTELGTGDFNFGVQPNLYLEGVSPMDPDIVFARADAAVDPGGDRLYRSADAGETWQEVLTFENAMTAFDIFSDGGTVIAGSAGPCDGNNENIDAEGCVFLSSEAGAPSTFSKTTQQPRMACVNQRAEDGELLACGENWNPDNFALGRSTDGGQTWESVFRFTDIDGPLTAPMDTPQRECAVLVWPSLCQTLGICDAMTTDAGPGDSDGGTTMVDGGGGGGGGCLGCSTADGGGRTSTLALVFAVFLGLVRRQRT